MLTRTLIRYNLVQRSCVHICTQEQLLLMLYSSFIFAKPLCALTRCEFDLKSTLKINLMYLETV